MSSNRKQPVPRTTASKYQPTSTSSRMTYVLVGIGVLLVAVLVIGGVVWNSQRSKNGADENVLSQNSSLIIGAATAPQTIDVFEDAMCPVCHQFEQQSGPAIAKAVDAGKLRVRYHLLNFLDRQSASGDYSSRAAGAMQCVGSGENKDTFLKFHSELFAQAPQEGGGSDHDNAAIARIAGDAGASDATQKCIADGAKVDAAKKSAQESTDQLSKATSGQVATPSVLSGGKPVENIMQGTGWLDQLLGSHK